MANDYHREHFKECFLNKFQASAARNQRDLKRLTPEFFCRPAHIVATELIGCDIYRVIGNEVIRMKIYETQAYYGENDTQSMMSISNKFEMPALWGEPGSIWFGRAFMVDLLNIKCMPFGESQAVYIRSASLQGGPGHIQSMLELTKSMENNNITNMDTLWITHDTRLHYIQLPRVGDFKLKPKVSNMYSREITERNEQDAKMKLRFLHTGYTGIVK